MNKKFQSMLKQQWTNRLLALFMCASLLLSSVAARPLAQSYDEAPPTPTSGPVLDTPTPEPVSPTQEPATPTDVAATPTEEQVSPTAEPPVPTDEPVIPTVEPATPTVEPAAPTPTEVAPTPTEVAPTQAPAVPVKPAQAINPKVVSGVNFHQLVIKFKNGYASSLSGQSLSAQSSPRIAPLLDLLQGVELKPFFSSLNKTPGAQATSQAAQAESVLSRYFVAQLPDSTDFAGAQQVLDSITALPFIDTAYMEPIYKPATTTDYTGQQNYLLAPGGADNGMGINCPGCAWDLDHDGGRGLGVKVYDIEQGWQIGHEDLPVNKSFLLESSNTSQLDWVNHGTAVLGVIGAAENGFGVNGIAPEAELRMVSSVVDARLTPRSLADAINLVVTDGTAGDVIVIPMEALGPVSEEVSTCPDPQNSSFEDIPVEYWQANFDAISAATDAGFIVVEAAGNGQMNLSADRYDDKFDRDSRDSGAILVGAGTSHTRAPICSSNFGKRIDLQGWGENVTTTGYGDLDDGGGDPNKIYTQEFGGTSAAAAMVAGAVASFQGVALDRDYELTPDEVREALHTTGTAQDSATSITKPIGPLPNLINAINHKIPDTVKLISPPNVGTPIYTLRPTLDWASFANASKYELQVSKGGTSNLIVDITTTSSIYTFTSNLSSGINYHWRVRAMVDSVWTDYSDWWLFYPLSAPVPGTTLVSPDNGAIFNHPADNPTFTWKKTTSSLVTDYELEISTASDFSTGPGIFSDAVDSADIKNHTFSGATLNPNTRYYWRVRCVIAGVPNNYSAWSSSRILYTSLNLVGSLTAPASGALADSLRPQFVWAAVPGAKAYSLQVATSHSFSSSSVVFSVTINIASGGTAPHNYYLMTSDLPRNRTAANPLYWRVRDLGNYGWSAFSLTPFLLKTGNPPGVPTISHPSSGAVVPNPTNVVVTWSTPSLATAFWLQISSHSNFSTSEVDVHNATSPYPASLSSETKYYMRLRAGKGIPVIWGNWTATRIFYTTPPDPTNLQPLTTPTDSLTPTFVWDVIPEASSYRIQVLNYNHVGGTCTSTVVLDKTITSPPPYTLTSSLPRNAYLCWRVRAGGLFGFSNWVTEGTEFRTLNPPYAPALLSPGNGASLATFAPLLDWGSSPYQDTLSRRVNQYEVQVSASKTFTSLILPDPPNPIIVEATSTQFQLGAMDLVDAGTYYWHVRAINTTDNTYSAWSATWSFLTPPQMVGTIYDAMTVDPTAVPPDPGTALAAVNLQISGTSWATTTDTTGAYSFRGLPQGTYDLLISKGNYMRQTRKISISRGNNIVQDFDIVPIPADNSDPLMPSTVRIQLTWGSTVADMDSNLWLPKMASPCLVNDSLNHLDSQDPAGCNLDPLVTNAYLVADDNKKYGTEVITIDPFTATNDDDPYVFAVQLNDAASKMGGSDARVTVYEGTDLKGTFSVPSTANGIWWKVFTLLVKDHSVSVTGVNTISSKNPGPY